MPSAGLACVRRCDRRVTLISRTTPRLRYWRGSRPCLEFNDLLSDRLM